MSSYFLSFMLYFPVYKIPENKLVRLYIYFLVLHYTVSDMFRLLLSHHQGDTIQGFTCYMNIRIHYKVQLM
jgi:hypothetical protein